MGKNIGKKISKSEPGSSQVHVPVPLGEEKKIGKEFPAAAEDKKAPAVPGAANPNQAERRVVPVVPPAPAKATPRSEGVIPPTIANLEAEVIKAAYGEPSAKENDSGAELGSENGDNATLGLYDMQQIIAGVDWETAQTPGLDFQDAQQQALENLETDPLYYRKRYMEAENTSDQLALTDTQKGFDDEDEDPDEDFVGKDTEQTEDESRSTWPEGLNLDLASGPVREPGYIGFDLYPHDHGTVVHDLTLGIPVEDGIAKNIRLVNGLQYIDGFNQDPKPLLAEIQRALMPDGEFVYEGPNELYNFPKWVEEGGVDGLQLMSSDELEPGENAEESEVEKIEGRPWVKQTYRRIAVPDAATSNDAEPRIGIAQYDQLPADALLAMDALGYYWSDSTSSGRGNRNSGYPSQGALLSRTQENEANQVGMAKPPGADAEVSKEIEKNPILPNAIEKDTDKKVETEYIPPKNVYALPAEYRYPLNTIEQAEIALRECSGRAEEEVVKNAVYRNYPELRGDTPVKALDTAVEVPGKVSPIAPSPSPMGEASVIEALRGLISYGKKLIDLVEKEPVGKADSSQRRVASIAVKHGKHLLMGARRDNGKWTMPGGHVNPNETMLEGAHRELTEETGIEAPKGYLMKIAQYEGTGKDGKPLLVHGFHLDMQHRPQTTMKSDPDAEVRRWKWVDVSKGLPDKISKNLHVPLENNCVLKAIGVGAKETVKKEFSSRTVTIRKADRRKQIVYCVVLSPEELDSQDDWMTAEDIEDAAHLFMMKARAIGSEHSKQIDAQPVESYIAPQDLNWDDGPYGPQVVKKGSWVIGIKIHDPKEWAKVENGDYQGVSVGGFGLRD